MVTSICAKFVLDPKFNRRMSPIYFYFLLCRVNDDITLECKQKLSGEIEWSATVPDACYSKSAVCTTPPVDPDTANTNITWDRSATHNYVGGQYFK